MKLILCAIIAGLLIALVAASQPKTEVKPETQKLNPPKSQTQSEFWLNANGEPQ
jgi:hypothetical protein